MIHLRDLDKNNNMSKNLAVVFQMAIFYIPSDCLLLELFSSILPNAWDRPNFASATGGSFSILGDRG